jgi:hypothetical protein
MEQQEPLLLESLLEENKDRNNLVPLWMKIFSLIFMITGILALICLFAGLFGAKWELALYGLGSNEPVSFTGILIILLFLYKGIVAFGLWAQKDWAVNFGVADAIIGIVICIFVMGIAPVLNNPSEFTLGLRLELVILIPYLIKLLKIKAHW